MTDNMSSTKVWYVEYHRSSTDSGYAPYSTHHAVRAETLKDAVLKAAYKLFAKTNVTWDQFKVDPRAHAWIEDLDLDSDWASGYRNDTHIELTFEEGDEFALEVADEIRRLLGLKVKEPSHRVVLEKDRIKKGLYVEVNLPKLKFSTSTYYFEEDLADPRSLTLEWLQDQIKRLIKLEVQDYKIGSFLFSVETKVEVALAS